MVGRWRACLSGAPHGAAAGPACCPPRGVGTAARLCRRVGVRRAARSRPRGVGVAPGCGCLHPAGAHCRPRRAAAESPGAESTQTSCSCERRPTAAQPRTCVARAVAGNSCSWRSWRLAAALHAASVESCCARHAVCRACLAINARRCHATCHMYFVSVMCVYVRDTAPCV